MISVIFNQQRSLHYDCIATSLFRDNVQHYLEGGVPTDRFLCIQAFADAPWEGRVLALNARKLLNELEMSWSHLRCFSVDDLAIGLRTRAMLAAAPLRPGLRGTVLYRSVNLPIPIDLTASRTLEDVFGRFITDLRDLARDTPGRGRLMVRGRHATAPG
ncbi:MAG: hypothetical protein ABJB12_07935 [Pseudomonadota bacterium]